MREKSRFRTHSPSSLQLPLALSRSGRSVAFLDHRSGVGSIVQFFEKNTRRGFPRTAARNVRHLRCPADTHLRPCRMWNRVWSGLVWSGMGVGVGLGLGLARITITTVAVRWNCFVVGRSRSRFRFLFLFRVWALLSLAVSVCH